MKIDFISDINKDNYYILDYDRIDLYMVRIARWNAALFALYAFGIYYFAPAALYPSPFSWRVVNLTETLWTVAIALFAAFLPAILRGRFKNHYLYRFITANALITFSYLFVFISGGSIEWHFHFFIIFALLTLYADWRLNWWGIIAVALHHQILNNIAPNWVYFYGENDLAFLAHALLVLFMAIATTKTCEQNRQLADASRLIGEDFKKI